MSFLPLARLEKITGTAPENLLFLSSADLIAVVSDAEGRYSEVCRQECIAELIIRWYLNPFPDYEQCLDTIFPAKEWHTLKRVKEREIFSVPTVSSLPQKLWTGSDSFLVRCEITVRKRLTDLLNADGFIPVYSGDEAFFLPFSLVENSLLPVIGDIAGVQIDNWTAPFLTLLGDSPKYRCVVRCHQSSYLPLFTGHSMMLPLYLAYQRKVGKLPQYNRLRLLSTGAIEIEHLKAVATEEKQKALKRCFSRAYLFFPESSKIHSEERNSVPLNISSDLEEVLEEIRKQIEAKGLVIPTFREAQSRLAKLDYETRHTNQSRWEDMIARLQTNMDAIQLSKDRDPESYLLCLMLKSAICCHMGNTAKALLFNKEAKDMARSLKLEKHLHRLEIEELVDLQDVEDFNSIRLLAVTLKDELEQLNDDDLLMRYYGTMGQAHCYGVLAKETGFEKEVALNCFRQSLSHAQNLESEQDIAQDLNYNYLWYVLFDPASEAADFAYKKANDHIERNLQTYPQSQKKNRYFLQRFKMQALYRRLLEGEIIHELDYQCEELPEDALFWLRALVGKYLGAIAAANGKQDLASHYFSDAIALLEMGIDDNIIAFIRMTILVEAYHSLHKEEYRESALETLSGLTPQYHNALKSWHNYLMSDGRYPGLDYWY